MKAEPAPGALRVADPDRLALLAAVALFAALALVGARYHWVEEAGSAERDGFVGHAETLAAGSLPRDPFRPLLYPLLTAALAPLAGDSFAAARLLSNLAAAALAWLAYRAGRELTGRPAAGGWAMALTAVNPNLWLMGQSCSTDMVFAAFAAAALVAALAYLERPRTTTALAIGLAWGLAAFTRSSAVLLVPALAVAWWLAREREGPPRRPLAHLRPGHLVLAVAVAMLVLIPHWWLRALAFGDPFYSRNWINLAWKIEGFPDWSYLDRVPWAGPGELLAARWREILAAGLAEAGRFALDGWRQLVGSWAHVGLFAAGLAVALTRWPRRTAWLGWAIASAAGLLSLLFFAWGRFLLFLIPLAAALSVAVLAAAVPAAAVPVVTVPGADGPHRRPSSRGPLVPRLVLGVLALAVAMLAVKTAVFRIPAWVERHPYGEVEALRRLAPETPPETVFAGTSPFLGRYVERRWVALPDAFGLEIERPELYYERLRRRVEEAGVDYLVVGPVDLRDRPPGLLGPTPPVGWLVPVEVGDEATVWRVRPPPR